MNDNIQISNEPIHNEGNVTLPCTKNDFNKFMKSLLGHSLKMEKNIEGSCELTKENIKTLNKMLLDRVSEQNGEGLINFLIESGYSSASSVFSNLDDFLENEEQNSSTLQAVRFIWDFVLIYEGRDYPEKQRVSIEFSNISRNSDNLINFDSGICIIVEYTAKTWAVDIMNMLEGYLKNLILSDLRNFPKVRAFLSDNLETVTIILGTLFFLVYMVVFMFRTNMRESISNLYYYNSFFINLFVLIIIIILCFFLINIFDKLENNSYKKSCYFIFSDLDRQKLNNEMKNIKSSIKSILFVIFLNVLTGIIANIIFTKIT